MMRFLFVFALSVLFTSVEPTYRVKVAGELRRIMQAGELSAVIKLDTIKNSQHLFGLGPAAYLKGEIITLDGVSYLSQIVGDQVVNLKKPDADAAMFVYAAIAEWDKHPIRNDVSNIQSLEQLIEAFAQQLGLDLSQPLPFEIKATRGTFTYHVIDWNDGAVHTMTSHKQFAKAGTITNEEVTILGFYSATHQGIITPHTSRIHAHMLRSKDMLVGHLDDLNLVAGFQLSFPKHK